VSHSHELNPAQAAPPVPSRPAGDVSDDHGRALTTNATAAAWYRVAQRSLLDRDAPDPALRHALRADPTFALAASDLSALVEEAPTGELSRPATSWERHHCEIVAEARRDVGRANGILREHLADSGCDPLAVHIVSAALHDAGRFADVDSLLATTPDCHTYGELTAG
jgi:hypothetical protein